MQVPYLQALDKPATTNSSGIKRKTLHGARNSSVIPLFLLLFLIQKRKQMSGRIRRKFGAVGDVSIPRYILILPAHKLISMQLLTKSSPGVQPSSLTVG
jgi:hypothetical protein